MTRGAVAERLVGTSLNAGQRSAAELIYDYGIGWSRCRFAAPVKNPHAKCDQGRDPEGAGCQVPPRAVQWPGEGTAASWGRSNTLASFLKGEDRGDRHKGSPSWSTGWGGACPSHAEGSSGGREGRGACCAGW